ncbi:MAG: redoxin domain-containing protein [Beijerinckiaceae bacterium]|nr:redoxin domain-containing protein [Beijerinckiaceae bacterium]
MPDLIPLMPRLPVPHLRAPLASGGHYDLHDERPALMSMIVFYRGLHCQQCQAYLRDLEERLPEFEKRGVTSVAISCDGADRARRTPVDWGLSGLRVAYGLEPRDARAWGLFLTAGRPRASGMSEPPVCCEPAVFLVAPDNTLWFSAVQNMAFARPRFEDLIEGFEFLFARGYFRTKECPARGELLDAP